MPSRPVLLSVCLLVVAALLAGAGLSGVVLAQEADRPSGRRPVKSDDLALAIIEAWGERGGSTKARSAGPGFVEADPDARGTLVSYLAPGPLQGDLQLQNLGDTTLRIIHANGKAIVEVPAGASRTVKSIGSAAASQLDYQGAGDGLQLRFVWMLRE